MAESQHHSIKTVFKKVRNFDEGQNTQTRKMKNGDQYTYEIPKTSRRGRKRKAENTRSLFDDPKMQKLKTITQKQVMEALKNPSNEKIPWNKLYPNQKTPPDYFMKQVYTGETGPKNFNQDIIQTEYDAFRLFFDEEVYDYILQHTHDYYHDQYKKEVYFYCTEQKHKRPKY